MCAGWWLLAQVKGGVYQRSKAVHLLGLLVAVADGSIECGG